MKICIKSALGVAAALLLCGSAEARGFGGFRAGGFSGYRAGGFSGYNRSFSYAGSRSFSGYSGWRGAGVSGSYDRSYSGSRGGSVNVEGTRGAAAGRYGGAGVYGSRDVTATGPGGRTYSSSRQGAAAVGPYGRTVGGASRTATATGYRGTATAGWQSAFAGNRFSTDFGLSHFSSVGGVTRVTHSTAYWSHGDVVARAGYVRTNFGYYNCFRPGWYTAHPGCWLASGWAAGAAWSAATWPVVASYVGYADPIDYDYGNTVVYQENNVYVNGQDVGTAQDYAQQAITLADQGQKAKAPTEAEWKALGVFALVQGDEKTSNNIFQLAVNKEGVIRGNYYDGLLDTTTEVYGSVDRKTQRAAWTIGKSTARVFEAGISNLTKEETPILVHIGKDKTQQWLLVRVEQPK